MPMDIRIGKTFEVETINGFKVLLTRPEEPEAEPASWSETPKSFGCLAHFGKMIQRCIPFLGRANKKKKKRGRRGNKVGIDTSVDEEAEAQPTSTQLLQSLAKDQVVPPRRLRHARLSVGPTAKARKAGITWDLEDNTRPVTPMRGRPTSRLGAVRPPHRLASLDVEKERRAMRRKADRVEKARRAAIKAKVDKARIVNERMAKTQERKVYNQLDKADLSVNEMKQEENGMSWSLDSRRPVTPLRPKSRAGQLVKRGRLQPLDVEEQLKLKGMRAEAARIRVAEERLNKTREAAERREKNQLRKNELETQVKQKATIESEKRQERSVRTESRHQDILLSKQIRARSHVDNARMKAERKRERDAYFLQLHQDKLISHPETTPREYVPPEQMMQSLIDSAEFWDDE